MVLPSNVKGLLLGLAVMATGVATLFWITSGPKVWARYAQPSGALAVVIYRLPLRFAIPGSSGDAPARIQLEDSAGKVLKSTDVPSLQIVTEPEWEKDRVQMKLVFDWQLRADGGPP